MSAFSDYMAQHWRKAYVRFNPLNLNVLALGGTITTFPENDWLCRFLYRHKTLKQWCRWIND